MPKPPLVLAALITLVATPAFADKTADQDEVTVERKNSVNLSPLGVLTGSYNLNYDRLFGAHGLIIESSLFARSDDDASSGGIGAAIGYRWHLSGHQNSWFVGAMAGFLVGTGDAEIGSGVNTMRFEVDTQVFSVVANIGKRWAWNNGLNLTIRAGAGYGNYSVTTDSQSADAQQAVEKVDELLSIVPVAIDGELSLGYTF